MRLAPAVRRARGDVDEGLDTSYPKLRFTAASGIRRRRLPHEGGAQPPRFSNSHSESPASTAGLDVTASAPVLVNWGGVDGAEAQRKLFMHCFQRNFRATPVRAPSGSARPRRPRSHSRRGPRYSLYSSPDDAADERRRSRASTTSSDPPFGGRTEVAWSPRPPPPSSLCSSD